MYEQDLHRAARDAQRPTAARVASPTRYSDAVNRYLGAHDYVERQVRTDTPLASAEPVTQAEPVVDRRGHTVVVGVDASPASAVAVDHAAIQAQLYGWDLRLVHVQTSLTEPSVARNEGAALLANLVERVHARTRDVAVVGRLEVGSPADLLLHAATGVGLLVLGSAHGRISGALGGSVCTQVAAHHPGPVMVVRMPAWPPGPDFAARPVVVGVDRCHDAAVAFGAREARLRVSDLVLLHAAEDGPDPVPELTFDPGLRVHRRRVDGPAWRALVEASRHAGAVVIGSRGHGGVSGLLLGSVGQRLIRQADCPVFIVR